MFFRWICEEATRAKKLVLQLLTKTQLPCHFLLELDKAGGEGKLDFPRSRTTGGTATTGFFAVAHLFVAPNHHLFKTLHL